MLNKRILVVMFLLVFLPLVGCIPSPAIPNQAPIITSYPSTTATVGETYAYDVEATDPDGDTLTYSLTVKPGGMTINSATGLVEWTPTAKGDYDVVVKVSDGALDITQSFTIVVSIPYVPPCCPPANHAPEITSIPGDTAEVCGEEYIYVIKATDPDGDAITYSLVSGPVGMTFDGTATISWTPTSLQVGANDVIVKASDGKGGKKDITQSFTITVADFPSIIIDEILSSGEWDCATEIPVAGDMGTVRVLATTDYLYVAFDAVDSNDARIDYEFEVGNDQISINVNPTDGGPWGFPYDLIFETSALSGGCSGSPEDGGHHCLPWNPKVNSGTSADNWATRWFPNDAQEALPVDLESATIYSGTNRITEWKLPLSSLPGDVLKIGGAIDVGDGNSYVYPVGLDWSNVLTYVDIVVY